MPIGERNPEALPGLSADERMQRVLRMLETRDSIQVSELAQVFTVSEVTVRSDLSELARQGRVARVRGGVPPLERGQSELGFDLRLRLDVGRKQAIAAALADAPGVNVLVTGGMLRLQAMSLVGELGADVFRTTRINTGFFGARGLSLERGLMDLNPDEVRIKREMAAACERVVGIFDGTKWHRTALLSFVPAERVDAIVTDASAPAEEVEAWRARGTGVVAPEVEQRAQAPARARELRRVPPLEEGAA